MIGELEAKGKSMQTPGKRITDQKYKREKCKTLTLRFYPTDMEILDHIKSQDNIAQYIKGLVREDMGRNDAS